MGQPGVEPQSATSLHLSHIVWFSMSEPMFANFCVNCGETDEVPGGFGKLDEPCTKPVGQGGMTLEEWRAAQK